MELLDAAKLRGIRPEEIDASASEAHGHGIRGTRARDTRHTGTGYEAQRRAMKKAQDFVIIIVFSEAERLQIFFKSFLNPRPRGWPVDNRPSARAKRPEEIRVRYAHGF
jgi:hypothetical protein